MPAVEPRAKGALRFSVEPQTAEVYVDGYYAGVVEDFNQAGVIVDAGVHRVEFVAPGYEILTVPLQVSPEGMTMYRQKMEPVTPPPVGPRTFYVIPRCYAGNVLPDSQTTLVPGCDLNRLQTFTIR